MLMKTTDLIHQISASQDKPARRVTGRYLTNNRLNARERANLAAEVIAGSAAIDASTLTVRQITKLCRANTGYVNEVRFPERLRRRQQKKFAAVFDAIGPDARAEACRTIGVERVWAALAAAL
jgi:hypothetical protein